MFKEFKAFALKGNMVDMAVGIIIGAAFTQLVSSLVKDIIMPPIGMLLGRVDFSKLGWTIQAKTAGQPAVVINYGQFVNTLIDFLILAFVIFIVIQQMNRLKKKQPEALPNIKSCPKCCSDIPAKAKRWLILSNQVVNAVRILRFPLKVALPCMVKILSKTITSPCFQGLETVFFSRTSSI